MQSAIRVFVAWIAAGVVAGPAIAQPPGTPADGSPAGQPAAAAQVADADKVVCKSEPVTGSRFSRKVCLTNAQWEQQQQDSKRMIERLQGAKVPPSG